MTLFICIALVLIAGAVTFSVDDYQRDRQWAQRLNDDARSRLKLRAKLAIERDRCEVELHQQRRIAESLASQLGPDRTVFVRLTASQRRLREAERKMFDLNRYAQRFSLLGHGV